MATRDTPVTDDEFAALFGAPDGAAAIALAVSGGADSLALLDLAERWSRRFDPRPNLLVLTVDHGLRPGSAAEAAMVAAVAAARGLAHRTLLWEGDKPLTGIEAAAREARYRLLAGAAMAGGAKRLVAAHHQDDQAETVLMRLGRGSGLAGLGGMAGRRWLEPGLRLERPLLGIPKSRLVATASAAGFSPAVDETNGDPRFARARFRQLMPSLAAEGIDAATLARFAALSRRADEALRHVARSFVDAHADVSDLAVVRVGRELLGREPAEIRLRVLAELIGLVGNLERPPGDEQLTGLDAAVVAPWPFRRTLGGAVVAARSGEVLLYREPGRVPIEAVAVDPGADFWWDRRFLVRVDGGAGGLTLGPLGEHGYADLPERHRVRPKVAALTLPAFRRDGRLVAVPPLGFRSADGAGLEATARVGASSDRRQ